MESHSLTEHGFSETDDETTNIETSRVERRGLKRSSDRPEEAEEREEVSDDEKGTGQGLSLRSDGDSARRIELLREKSSGNREENVGDEEHGQSDRVFRVVAIENTLFESLCERQSSGESASRSRCAFLELEKRKHTKTSVSEVTTYHRVGKSQSRARSRVKVSCTHDPSKRRGRGGQPWGG